MHVLSICISFKFSLLLNFEACCTSSLNYFEEQRIVGYREEPLVNGIDRYASLVIRCLRLRKQQIDEMKYYLLCYVGGRFQSTYYVGNVAGFDWN